MRQEVSRSRQAIAAVSLGVFLLGIMAVLGVSVLITGPLNGVVETARLNQGLEERVQERTRELEREVADHAEAERLLRVSRKRYALAARGSNDGLWDWDLLDGSVYFSPRWRSMIGFEEQEVTGPPSLWLDQVHPADRELLDAQIEAHITGRTEHFQHEYRLLHADGSFRWMLARGLAVRDAEGRATRMSGSQTDITDRKRAEEQLIHDALRCGPVQVRERQLWPRSGRRTAADRGGPPPGLPAPH